MLLAPDSIFPAAEPLPDEASELRPECVRSDRRRREGGDFQQSPRGRKREQIMEKDLPRLALREMHDLRDGRIEDRPGAFDFRAEE